MNIRRIEAEKLRGMHENEGLILQGCGGSPEEWADGINNLLTLEEILLEGSTFQTCIQFENEGVTCLLFPFEEVKLDVGKLAMWRLGTYDTFGGTWLSDYVPNRLGGFVNEEKTVKPDCALIGQDGNIFNLMGIASRTLKAHGMEEQAKEMREKITASGNYGEALNIIGEYVNITDGEEDMEEGETMEEVRL